MTNFMEYQEERFKNAIPIYAGMDQEYAKLKGCPECEGRGYFCLNPFAETNKKFVRCQTCVEAERYFKKHGELPEHIASKIKTQ